MNIEQLLNRVAAMPHTHVVVTRYMDGAERRHETRNIQSAETFAIGERRKIGRDLISRETGKTVRIVAVNVLPLETHK